MSAKPAIRNACPLTYDDLRPLEGVDVVCGECGRILKAQARECQPWRLQPAIVVQPCAWCLEHAGGAGYDDGYAEAVTHAEEAEYEEADQESR